VIAALRTGLLVGATVTMGLSAGVFDVFSHTVMPGLKKTDDRTFIGAFQAIDKAIMNPWFIGITFTGALLVSAAAAFTQRGRPPFAWIVTAVALYLVCVITTSAVNVPLNDALKAAGDPARIADLAAVRAHFHETRWAAWNLVRSLTSTGAFISLAWALVLHGRATA
jgi:uncharacterized membrane protein